MQSAQLRVDSQSAAADGCTTIIPTSKKFPVFRKIIRRYVLRCERKKRQVITFSLSNFHGQTTTVQKSIFGGTTIVNDSIIASWKPIKIPVDSSAIIIPFTILRMVSRRTLAELDVRSARKYVTVKRSLSSSPIYVKSLRSSEFNLFSNFNKVWSTSIARRKHRTI